MAHHQLPSCRSAKPDLALAAIIFVGLLAMSGRPNLHCQEPVVAPKQAQPEKKEQKKLSFQELLNLANEKGEIVGRRPPEMTFPMDAKAVFKVQDQWSFYLKQPKVVTNSAKMKLTVIPPGRFVMGTKSRAAKNPPHNVIITRPFYIGVYEVTQQEYENVMGYNPSDFAKDGRTATPVSGMDTRRFPVEGVRHTDADAFCRTLSERAEEKKAGRVYRLPTEAEWEYACRAGTNTVFHFGDSCGGKDANIDGFQPHPQNGPVGPFLRRTTQVGSYKPNAFGLYDMHGNVAEMCSDWYVEGYMLESPEKDPQGPKAGGDLKVIRGGWYSWSGGGCATAVRYQHNVGWRGHGKGFRVVCEIRAMQDEKKVEAK